MTLFVFINCYSVSSSTDISSFSYRTCCHCNRHSKSLFTAVHREPSSCREPSSTSTTTAFKTTDPISFCNCLVIEWDEADLQADREELHYSLIGTLSVIYTSYLWKTDMYPALQTIYENSINCIAERMRFDFKFENNSRKILTWL